MVTRTRLIVTFIRTLPVLPIILPNAKADWSAKILRIWKFSGPNLCPKKVAIMADNYRGFYQSLQENTGILPAIKPRPLHSKFYAANYSNLDLETDYTSESRCGSSQLRQENNEILIKISTQQHAVKSF